MSSSLWRAWREIVMDRQGAAYRQPKGTCELTRVRWSFSEQQRLFTHTEEQAPRPDACAGLSHLRSYHRHRTRLRDRAAVVPSDLNSWAPEGGLPWAIGVRAILSPFDRSAVEGDVVSCHSTR